MAAKRIAGTAYLKRDGLQYALRGTLTISPLRVTRSGVAGLDGVHGFKEEARVPYIEAEVTKDETLSLKALEGVTDSTVTAECGDGTVYVLASAWQAGDLDFNAAEGSVSIRFEGMSCAEVLPT